MNCERLHVGRLLFDFVDSSTDLVNVNDASYFERASVKWKRVITGKTEDIIATLPGNSECGPWPSFVDDLYICGKYKSLDGPGGVLGYAGPTYVRTGGSATPITGSIVIDSADVGQEWLDLYGVIVSKPAI